MTRDHGGGIDAAIARFGGTRSGWVDLSTGINPVPYPVGDIIPEAWTALPDKRANEALLAAARRFWNLPDEAGLIAAPGASAIIARIPGLTAPGAVHVPGPTYNEHAASFRFAGHQVVENPASAVRVLVHPNNPDGRVWSAPDIRPGGLTIIDESFCDVMPEQSHIGLAGTGGVIVLKSFGKFWGLAGLRLGFAAGPRARINDLAEMLGPWAVSGPALAVGTAALSDPDWAAATRVRLEADAQRLDGLMTASGARVAGGTTLFRLYEVEDAMVWQDRLADGHVWSRVFPYSRIWLRLGLPHPDRWDQVEAAL
ncbi:MAG: pyridoxal phosphate-dependent class II aminotransferase [Rhodobacterales bacterium]|nr:pyridoxal phosphate-dependent class II aminotransferase [Rhodobacterales bacterium]